MDQATSSNNYHDNPRPSPVPSIAPPQQWSNDQVAPPRARFRASAPGNLREELNVNQYPPSVQPGPLSYPYSSSFFQPTITQPQQQPPICPPPQLDSVSCTSKNQEPAPPAPKRRKMEKPKMEIISLLSDDEDDLPLKPAIESTVKSRTIYSSQSKKPPRLLEHISAPRSSSSLSSGHRTIEENHGRTTTKTYSRVSPEPSLDSMRAAKALAKSAIRQRSSQPPMIESSPPRRFTRHREDTPSPISFSPLPSSPGTSFRAPEDDDSDHMPTPPPSSFLEADSMPTGQQGPVPRAANPEEPQLCPEQARLVDLIVSGKNVFYTGSAGCGKSTVLKAFTKLLRDQHKNVRILAPTGRAALQVNGSTTWTYAGWTPNHHKKKLDELKEAAHGKFVWKRFQETDVLVIDEISMVENLHFERLNEVMKEARHNPKLDVQPAFGGVQVVVTGDFCQLPPVKPFKHCIECGFELVEKSNATGKVHVCVRHGEYRDEDKWAFRSKAWEECNFVHVHLNTIHRQSDETFIRILQKCRIGRELSIEDTNLLMDHKCMVHHATKLFATREEVANVNRGEFERLKTVNHSYWCLDEFIWRQQAHPHLSWKGMRKPPGPQSEGPLRALEDHRFEECVQLKKGMLVVLLVNLDLKLGLCNGSQGLICGFEKYDRKKLPQAVTGKKEPENKLFGARADMKEAQIKKFIEDPGAKYKMWPIVRFHNGLVRTIFADCSITELGDERPYSLLMRTQIPLAPAWAMTIHKSQSLTLDRVVVNLSRAFEEGQVYVALSRATGLHGLKIEGDSKGLLAGLGGNKEVQQFLREKFGDLDGVLSSGS